MNIIRIRNNNLNDNTLLYRGTNPRQKRKQAKNQGIQESKKSFEAIGEGFSEV